jgi:hypothetical protein
MGLPVRAVLDREDLELGRAHGDESSEHGQMLQRFFLPGVHFLEGFIFGSLTLCGA